MTVQLTDNRFYLTSFVKYFVKYYPTADVAVHCLLELPFNSSYKGVHPTCCCSAFPWYWFTQKKTTFKMGKKETKWTKALEKRGQVDTHTPKKANRGNRPYLRESVQRDVLQLVRLTGEFVDSRIAPPYNPWNRLSTRQPVN